MSSWPANWGEGTFVGAGGGADTGGGTGGTGGTGGGPSGGGTSPGLIVQTATNGTTPTLEVHTTTTMSMSFGAPTLPGNSIAVFLYLDADNIDYPSVSSVTDNRGNSYSKVAGIIHVTDSGPGIECWFCGNAAAGTTTITVHYAFDWLGFGAHTATFVLMGIAAEITGLGASAAFQDGDIAHNFGNSTTVLTISDHFSNSFSATIESPSNYNGWEFVDFFGNAIDLSFVAGGSASNTPDDVVSISPGNSSTLVASVSLSSYGHFGLYSGALALSPTVRGNIDWDDVGLDARQGPVRGRKIVYSDGSYTTGKVPIFLDDGTLSNSDVDPGGGGSGVGTDLLTEKGDLFTFDGTADVRFARGEDGYLLSSQSGQLPGLLWIPNPVSVLNSPGDLLTFNGTAAVRIARGTDGYLLSASSGQPDGLAWVPSPGSILTTKGDLIGHNGTAEVRFGVGASGYLLSADPGQPDGLAWVSSPTTALTTLTTRGDLLGHNGTAAVRFAVGVDGAILTADSTQADGFRWATTATVQYPWDASINFIGKMTDGQTIPIATLRRATTIPANFAGSGGFVSGTNPSATVTMAVKRNGSSIGTVSVSTSGAFTFATTSGAVVNGVLDDRLTMSNQATADVAFDTFNVTFAFLR